MHTKIILLALCFGLTIPTTLRSQDLEINGFAGWVLAGRANLWDGEFRIDDAMNYGGRMSVGLSTTTFAEVSYMRMDTEGQFFPYNIGENPSAKIPFSGNYIQVAGLQGVDAGPIFPFLSIGAGLTVWSPKTNQLNSKTQFSMSVGGGFKLWISEHIGIRLQGSMLMPMVFEGWGFGCGIGGGGTSCGSNVYTRITPFQGEFSGGLILKLTPQ